MTRRSQAPETAETPDCKLNEGEPLPTNFLVAVLCFVKAN